MPDDLKRLMHALFLPTVHRIRDALWHPSADVYRTPTGWLVKFDLAGVRPEEITLTVRGHRLSVSGCRRDWISEEGHRHYSLEIAYSCFERSIDLPFDLEQTRITTDYRDGMLLVRIDMETSR
jgi:HSP20 family protein